MADRGHWSSSDSSVSDGVSRRRPPPARRTEQDDEEDAIRSALHYAVGRICREEEDHSDHITDGGGISGDGGSGTRMSAEAIAALTELTYRYATTSLANDLVAFSDHAGRRTVNVEDVKLVLRKGPDEVRASLDRYCETNGLVVSATGERSGRRRRVSRGRPRNSAEEKAGAAGNLRKGKENFASRRSKSPKERRREAFLRRVDGVASSSSSRESGSLDDSSSGSSDVEIEFEVPLGKEQNVEESLDDGFQIGSDNGVMDRTAGKKKSLQSGLKSQLSDTESEGSSDNPIVARRGRRLKNSKRASAEKLESAEKPIDLTVDG